MRKFTHIKMVLIGKTTNEQENLISLLKSAQLIKELPLGHIV